MSSLNDAYDHIKTRIAAVIPDYKRLPEAYDIEQNPSRLLEKGWCIAFGSASVPVQEIRSRQEISRVFNVVLTIKVFANDMDADAKEFAEKALFTAQRLLINDLVEQDYSRVPANINEISYSSDRGIETVYGEKDQYLKLDSAFDIHYHENIALC